MLLAILGSDSPPSGRLTSGTRRCSTGFRVPEVWRPCERCPSAPTPGSCTLKCLSCFLGPIPCLQVVWRRALIDARGKSGFVEYGGPANDALGVYLRILCLDGHSLLHFIRRSSFCILMFDASVAQGEEERVAPKVASAIVKTPEPLRNTTCSDGYEATYHLVGRQHPNLNSAEWNTDSLEGEHERRERGCVPGRRRRRDPLKRGGT
jgi:hypothetical protein